MRWLLVLTLLLAGCGFHLQGSAPAQAELPVFSISGLPESHPLVQELDHQRSLYRQQPEHQWRAQISELQWQQRALSHAVDGTAVEYELRLELHVDVLDQQSQTVMSFPVSVAGDYSFSPTLILSKGVEETRLREELIQRTASIILRRLAYH